MKYYLSLGTQTDEDCIIDIAGVVESYLPGCQMTILSADGDNVARLGIEITPEEYAFLKLKYETSVRDKTEEWCLIDTDLLYLNEIKRIAELRK